jgi:hypothetical protein
MPMIRKVSLVLVWVPVMLSVWAACAMAQSSSDSRVAVTVSAGARPTASDFSQFVSFEAYSEEGSLTTSYSVKQQPLLNVGIAGRIWHGLGAGVEGTYLHNSFPAQITALVPHPLIANQPRTVSGDATVSNRQLAMHLEAVYWIRRSDRLEVLATGGPSFVRADQDFVTDVSYTQTFPYNTATFAGADISRQRKSAVGANIGAQIGWRLKGPLGVAGLVRYSHVTYHIPTIGAASVPLGGLDVGGGVRFLF